MQEGMPVLAVVYYGEHIYIYTAVMLPTTLLYFERY